MKKAKKRTEGGACTEFDGLNASDWIKQNRKKKVLARPLIRKKKKEKDSTIWLFKT